MHFIIIGLLRNIFKLNIFVLGSQNVQVNPDDIKLQIPEEREMHRWHLVSTYFSFY